MVASAVFIGAIIAGLTQLVKNVRDKNWNAVSTICIALAVGLLVALLDVQIGVADITVAQGLLIALSAVGVVGTAEKIG